MWYDFKKEFPEIGSTVVVFDNGNFSRILYNGDKSRCLYNGYWTELPCIFDGRNKINWEYHDCKITPNFKVHEALWLQSIKEYHIPTEVEKNNIYKMALRMELVRRLLDDKPIIVHCWIRPRKVNCKNIKYNEIDYNKTVGGAKNSWHIKGLAVDFHVLGHLTEMGCNTVKNVIRPMLNQYDIRMKDNPGSTFIHIDCGTVTHERFFK